jgi:hypothetical protein
LAKGTEGNPHNHAAFVPMGRIGQPDEIADPVVFLLSEEARDVTGHTLPVEGGVCSQLSESRFPVGLSRSIRPNRRINRLFYSRTTGSKATHPEQPNG